MNAIERLESDLVERFPTIKTKMFRPDDRARGTWQMDILRAKTSPVVVEWRCDRGFGVTSTDDDDPGLGSAPDEVFTEASDAYNRIVRLVLSGGLTEPPPAVRLAELRRSQCLTQAQLAELSGVKQANISRIEGRHDILVSTLARIVTAMGARLSIRACFPDGREHELDAGLMASPAAELSTSPE